MNFTQAIEVVNEVKTEYRFPGLLETLEYMQENREEFNATQRMAFGVVFREMGKLFAPA